MEQLHSVSARAPIMSTADTPDARDGDKVIPGDYLGTQAQFSPGPGTYTKGTDIFSTRVGTVVVDSSKPPQPLLRVVAKHSLNSIPNVGSVVVGRVLNISERLAKLVVISVDGKLLQEPLNGVLRKEDVRAVEKDTVDIFASFRPGDIVRARVISLGESHTFYGLSTANNELGVIMATSERGYPMGPVSWSEMQCSQTGVRETRKVAKVKNAVPIPS